MLPMKARLAAKFAKRTFRGAEEVQSHTTLVTSANTDDKTPGTVHGSSDNYCYMLLCINHYHTIILVSVLV